MSLPNGWSEFCIADAGGTVGGKTPSKAEPRYWSPPEIPWASPKDMKKFLLESTEDRIASAAVSRGGMTVLPKDTVLMVTRSGILARAFPVAIARITTAINQDIKAVLPSAVVDARYLAYVLRANEREILNSCRKAGTTVASINTDHLEKFRLPLAPSAEQKCIADKLDDLLARVAACSDHLDRVPGILKRFRESVLHAAANGELTDAWRRAQNIDHEWPVVALREVCRSIADGDHQAPPRSENGIPFITISAMNAGELRLDEATRFVPQTYHDSLKPERRPAIGDVLISVTGSIGLVALIRTQRPFVIQRHIAIARPDLRKVTSEFLSYRLSTDDMRRQGLAVATGTAQLTIPLGGLRSMTFRLPTLREQDEVCRRITELFAMATVLEEKCRQATNRVSRLIPSMLTTAFHGELVPPDPSDEF